MKDESKDDRSASKESTIERLEIDIKENDDLHKIMSNPMENVNYPPPLEIN